MRAPDNRWEAVSACPANGLALRCLAMAAAQAGALDEALGAYDTLVHIAADSDWAHADRGRALLVARRPAEALEPLRRALELNRWNVSAQRGLASAHANLGDLDAARSRLEGALRLHPRNGLRR